MESSLRGGWVAVLLSLVSLQASAQGGDLQVQVQGLVCATCAQDMVRRLEMNPAVERAEFSLPLHRLRVHLRAGKQLSDQRITDIVRDAGYPTGRVERKFASAQRGTSE